MFIHKYIYNLNVEIYVLIYVLIYVHICVHINIYVQIIFHNRLLQDIDYEKKKRYGIWFSVLYSGASQMAQW